MSTSPWRSNNPDPVNWRLEALEISKGDLIPEAAAEEITGELQALFARHRINFELRMLNFEFLQLSAFQFQRFLPVVPLAASVKTKLGKGGTGKE